MDKIKCALDFPDYRADKSYNFEINEWVYLQMIYKYVHLHRYTCQHIYVYIHTFIYANLKISVTVCLYVFTKFHMYIILQRYLHKLEKSNERKIAEKRVPLRIFLA